MNTGAHLIFGAAVFAKPDDAKVTTAALLGAFAPDASLYIMVAWHRLVLNTPPRIIFNDLYFSEAWMQVFRIDNSFLIWGAALALAIALHSKWAIAFAGAALLHLAFDFPLHHDDGRPHFWPLTDWIYESPVSYWDNRHHGGIIGSLELIASLLLLGVLWQRFKGVLARAMVGIGAFFQASPVFFWAFVFAG